MLGKVIIHFGHQSAIFVSIGNVFQGFREFYFPIDKGLNLAGKIRDKGEDDPMSDSGGGSTLKQRWDVLTVGVVTVEVKEEFGSDVIMAIDDHVLAAFLTGVSGYLLSVHSKGSQVLPSVIAHIKSYQTDHL